MFPKVHNNLFTENPKIEFKKLSTLNVFIIYLNNNSLHSISIHYVFTNTRSSNAKKNHTI